MASKKGLFNRLKKSISLRNVIKGAASVGASIPIVGGALQAAANIAAGARRDVKAATQQSARTTAAIDGGSATVNVDTSGGSGPGLTFTADGKKWLLWGGLAAAGLLAVILFVKVKK